MLKNFLNSIRILKEWLIKFLTIFIWVHAVLLSAQSNINTAEINELKWMGRINDNVSLANLSIPGTHDSGADFGCPTFLYNAYAKCQTLTVTEQLEAGIRYLDIRCRRVNNEFIIYHGQCSQRKKFEDVLDSCNNFLKENPSEAILMRIGEEYKAENSISFKTIFKTYENKYSNIWYTSLLIPKMEQIRGKIVIIDDASLSKGINYNSKLDNQDEYYHEDIKSKWKPIFTQLNKASQSNLMDKIYLNHTSATGFNDSMVGLLNGLFNLLPTPKDFSDYNLPLLEAYFKINNFGRFGIIIMDFPTKEIIIQIIESNKDKMNN